MKFDLFSDLTGESEKFCEYYDDIAEILSLEEFFTACLISLCAL